MLYTNVTYIKQLMLKKEAIVKNQLNSLFSSKFVKYL